MREVITFDRSMELFATGHYEGAFSSLKSLLTVAESADIRCPAIILALLTLMMIEVEMPNWLNQAPGFVPLESSTFFPLYLALEGSMKFAGEIEKGRLQIETGIQLSNSSQASLQGSVLLCNAIFLMNTDKEINTALSEIDKSLILYAADPAIDPLLLYFHYYALSIKGSILNRMSRFAESIYLLQKTMELNKNSYASIVENCWLGLASAYAGLADRSRCFQAMEQNIDFWRERGIMKRLAVATTVAGLLALQLDDVASAHKYFSMRRSAWKPVVNHWNMIAEAWRSYGDNKEAEQWVWP